MTDDARIAALRARVDDLMPTVRADLERLVAVPSVSFAGYDPLAVTAGAEAAAAMLRDAGATDVAVVDAGAGVPVVRADVPGPPGAPTVMLYAHYDVQPPGDEAQWLSPPFTATERDGRLYGRGAADDKSGCVIHAASVRAFDGNPPVSLRILLEGEEESGGAFEEWPSTRPEAFEGVDALVVADVGNLRVGEPALTRSLRGVVDAVVEVRTLAGPAHSGNFGGPAPDALMVLIRLLATLTDDGGNAAIKGIPSVPWTGDEYPEDLYREMGGILPGVPLIGSGTIAERLFTKPSVNVVGLDAPAVDTAPNALVPYARAKVSVRIPPGVDPAAAMRALHAHLESNAPWGVDVVVVDGRPAEGTALPTDGPAFRAARRAMQAAFGREAGLIGSGGSIPFVANVAECFPEMEVLLYGTEEPLSVIHAPNESVSLAELRDVTLAQVLFLDEYGSAAR